MLLPEQMSKIIIVGSKDRLKKTIDILYDLENVHLIDFKSSKEDIEIGSPLPEGSETSKKLLKLRGVEKDLEVNEKEVDRKVRVDKIEKDLEAALTTLEMETSGVVDSKNKIQHRISDLKAKKRELEPFLGLPLDLDKYSGYDSLSVFVGSIRGDPENSLEEGIPDFELFWSKNRKHVALFVPNEEADQAHRLLVKHGFAEIPVPENEGPPERMMKEIDEELEALNQHLEKVSNKLEKLREKHAAFIVASDEHLSIRVEKAEAPLRMGVTDHSFIMDAWVPTSGLGTVEKALEEEFKDDIHMEELERKTRQGKEEEEEEPPVKLDNPSPVGLFEYLIELISIPKYNEIDPTSFVSILFPLFFGLMVGDIGYGLAFLGLGYLGLKKCESEEWRTIATMLFYGGFFSLIFGIFFFGEALGMHFAPTGHEGDITWSSLLGIHFPHEIDLGALVIPLGMFSKLHDVKILLYISIWIGIIHLFLGFILGFINVAMRHGFKHAVFEKLSWILILVGGVLVGLEMMNVLLLGQEMNVVGFNMVGGLGLLIPGVVLGYVGEGSAAILELPGLMSNIFSYTRLTAIGMSKAGMALAFNQIAIAMLAPSGGAMIAAALVIFVLGHLMIFILAIISAGLHGIRLQYVEFFTKFYEGGGLMFNPLKIVRKYTEV